MNSRPTPGSNGGRNADVHALTGAYVLDAVTADERADFERHLAECEACAQEVAELRDTATRLEHAATADPPPQLRAAVLARITEVRQLPPETETPASPPHRPATPRLAMRLTTTAAAVLLVVATTLGVLLVREQQAAEDTRRQAETMATILRADDTRITTERDTSGSRMTVVASRSQNRALLLGDQLPPAPSGHDYQAWTIGTRTRSAGVLAPDDGRVFLEVNGIETASQVGITIEPAGGSDQPTTDPIMQLSLQ